MKSDLQAIIPHSINFIGFGTYFNDQWIVRAELIFGIDPTSAAGFETYFDLLAVDRLVTLNRVPWQVSTGSSNFERLVDMKAEVFGGKPHFPAELCIMFLHRQPQPVAIEMAKLEGLIKYFMRAYSLL